MIETLLRTLALPLMVLAVVWARALMANSWSPVPSLGANNLLLLFIAIWATTTSAFYLMHQLRLSFPITGRLSYSAG